MLNAGKSRPKFSRLPLYKKFLTSPVKNGSTDAVGSDTKPFKIPPAYRQPSKMCQIKWLFYLYNCWLTWPKLTAVGSKKFSLNRNEYDLSPNNTLNISLIWECPKRPAATTYSWIVDGLVVASYEVNPWFLRSKSKCLVRVLPITDGRYSP